MFHLDFDRSAGLGMVQPGAHAASHAQVELELAVLSQTAPQAVQFARGHQMVSSSQGADELLPDLATPSGERTIWRYS